jgi:hypothetical protein
LALFAASTRISCSLSTWEITGLHPDASTMKWNPFGDILFLLFQAESFYKGRKNRPHLFFPAGHIIVAEPMSAVDSRSSSLVNKGTVCLFQFRKTQRLPDYP